MRAGSTPARFTSSAITTAPRSSGRTSASAPRNRPIGVRTASAIRTSRNEPAIPEIYLLKDTHRGEAGDRAAAPVGQRRERRDREGGRARGLGGCRLGIVVDVAGQEDAADQADRAAEQRGSGGDRAR